MIQDAIRPGSFAHPLLWQFTYSCAPSFVVFCLELQFQDFLRPLFIDTD